MQVGIKSFGLKLHCERSSDRFGGLNPSSTHDLVDVSGSTTRTNVMYTKFFHADLVISSYNTIDEEYTVEH